MSAPFRYVVHEVGHALVLATCSIRVLGIIAEWRGDENPKVRFDQQDAAPLALALSACGGLAAEALFLPPSEDPGSIDDLQVAAAYLHPRYEGGRVACALNSEPQLQFLINEARRRLHLSRPAFDEVVRRLMEREQGRKSMDESEFKAILRMVNWCGVQPLPDLRSYSH